MATDSESHGDDDGAIPEYCLIQGSKKLAEQNALCPNVFHAALGKVLGVGEIGGCTH